MRQDILQPKATTPKAKQVSSSERAWLRSLGLHHGQYLDNKHCDYPSGYCSINALHYCLQHPEAEIVNGWVLWKSSTRTELEFHTLVRVNGRLRDITRRADKEATILFLEDKKYWPTFDRGYTNTYQNIQFPMIMRFPLSLFFFDGIEADCFQNYEIKEGKHELNETQKLFIKNVMDEIRGYEKRIGKST